MFNSAGRGAVGSADIHFAKADLGLIGLYSLSEGLIFAFGADDIAFIFLFFIFSPMFDFTGRGARMRVEEP